MSSISPPSPAASDPAAWYPSRLLTGSKLPINPFAIIILNQPVNKRALDATIERASLLVCADAGANRLLDYDQTGSYRQRNPDAIVGDLDSLSDDARHHYERNGVSILEDPDQYSTDFTKCLLWTRKVWGETHSTRDKLDVIVFGGLGGRVDQGFSQIHHLYMTLQKPSLLQGRIYLLSEQSLSFVLDNGLNRIAIEPDTFRENVGIIPVAGPLRITTSGLEWDVKDWLTQFGGQVSTSNHLRADNISIEVVGAMPLFTLELADRFSSTAGS